MPNAQEYVEKNYPDQSITELDISERSLPSSLNLSAYQQLEMLDCSTNQLTRLDLSGCQRLTKINCSWNHLTSLDLSGCQQLKSIDCFFNQLTNLNLSHNSCLTSLDCSSNQFNNVDFLTTLTNPEKIIDLSLYDNPINQTLNFLTPFVGLESLWLGANNENEITNFNDSLFSLGRLRKLKYLDISNTNLNSDLELLPAQLEIIYADDMPEIKEKMKGFVSICRYNYQAWREANLHLIAAANTIKDNKKLLSVLGIISKKKLSTRNRQVLNTLVFSLEQAVIDARKALYKENEHQAQVEQLPK